MWVFKGKYSGEAKAYVKKKEKKQFAIASLVYSIFVVIINAIMSALFGNSFSKSENITLAFSVGLGMIVIGNLILFLYYKRDPKCVIEITNDCFNVYQKDLSISFVFYKIETIEYYDDFIVIKNIVKNIVVLQKELLIEGDWEELKILLKKIEDSLDSDEPMYQLEEPATEFFTATVKEKRIYKKFVNGVSTVTPVGVFQYFATFELDDDNEVEYEIGQEWYEKIEQEETGTLVIVNGNFFSFGKGEDIQ